MEYECMLEKEADMTENDKEMMDLRAFKLRVERSLPANHPLRVALNGTPDILPRTEARIRLASYLTLLFNSGMM
jgi:hypothetical protein